MAALIAGCDTNAACYVAQLINLMVTVTVMFNVAVCVTVKLASRNSERSRQVGVRYT